MCNHNTDLAPGWFVALETATDVHVGQVQSVTDHGVRLTLLDWVAGSCCGMDLWVPWGHITEMVVATDEHDPQSFDWGAHRTRRMEALRSQRLSNQTV